MRFPLATAACFGLAVLSMSLVSQPSAQPPPQGRLLVFNSPEGAESEGGARILRGSGVTARATSDAAATSPLGPGRWQAVGGERFWIFDQQSGKLVGCRNIGTPNVGERDIDCDFGTVSRFRRTFGNNFRH